MCFNKLTVVKRCGTANNGSVLWLCMCECGNAIKVRSCNLRSGHTRSCGKCSINTFTMKDEIIIGNTANDESFIFDTKFFDMVKKYSWYVDERGCVKTNINGKILRLHNLIMGKTKLEIDHINNNPSDNRIANLRFATHQQNSFSRPIRADNTSGYKGVYFNKKVRKYQSTIVFEGKQNYIGLFDSAKEAAKAYNQKATELFGMYAFLNEI